MLGRISQMIAVLLLVASAFAEIVPTIPVNCAKGQTLNGTLSKLPKVLPVTILLQGTCTEYVTIDGFENLTIKGASGAAIQQPASTPPPAPNFVLSITGSRDVSISGLGVLSLS